MLGLGQRGHRGGIHVKGDHPAHLEDLLGRAGGEREEVGLRLQRGEVRDPLARQNRLLGPLDDAGDEPLHAGQRRRQIDTLFTHIAPPIRTAGPHKQKKRREPAAPSQGILSHRPGGPQLHFFDDDRRLPNDRDGVKDFFPNYILDVPRMKWVVIRWTGRYKGAEEIKVTPEMVEAMDPFSMSGVLKTWMPLFLKREKRTLYLYMKDFAKLP